MNKLFFTVLALTCLFVIPGCSTKFNVAAPYKNITVVDGYLDASDTAHYIRIQKAFLSQNSSALTMAQTPDSSFYASLNVKMELIRFTDSAIVDTIHLNRVDLDQEGYTKPAGQFFNSPNYAYKFKNALDPNYLYRLVITNSAAGQVDSVTTPVIEDTTGTYFSIDIFNPANKEELDFASTQSSQFFLLTGSYNTYNQNFLFEGLTNPAYIGQTIIRFNWDDSSTVTKLRTPRYYDFNAGYFTLNSNGGINVQLYNTTLYSAIAAALDPAPANTYRLIDRATIFVYLSTQDFSNYEQSTLSQGVGLTASEIEPIYSNIQGPGAIGLFTARGMRSGNVTITGNTIDSLMVYPLLSSANIVGTAY